MKKSNSNATTPDTIVAIATAPGRGSVGILRLSGPHCRELATQFTQLAEHSLKPRYAHYGNFHHPQSGEVMDQGISLFFAGPHSFTGEDVLELQGHGGPVVMDQLLQAALTYPQVRLAKAGEFSERAFLNDKMDLTQAEAIADLINAASEQAARNAVKSLQGEFSSKIDELVDKITHLRLYTEAAIDFPEEEIDFLQDETLTQGIEHCQRDLAAILQQAQQGVLIQEGMSVVIIGKPNAGKSSLLNALAGKDSAIVTDIPGTTRDLLTEQIHIDGLPLHIIDTAGFRQGGDKVEQMGMARAREAIEKADRLLLLIDANQTKHHASLEDLIKELGLESSLKDSLNTIDYSRTSAIYNKTDLIDPSASLPEISGITTLFLSAKTGAGLDALKEHLKASMGYQQASEGCFTARRRHISALELAQEHLVLSQSQLSVGAGELMAEELRQTQLALGEITGHLSADDLLGKIFSSFCIGK